MSIQSALAFVTCTIGCGIIFLAVSYVFYTFIYAPYKRMVYIMPFDECMSILTSMIRSELELFDNDIFRNNKIITNSSLEMAYQEISKRVIRRLSPFYWKQLDNYLMQDEVIAIISRTVKNHLVKRIGYQPTVTPPEY